ncbi:MAG: hypothetical protein KAR06_06655 [Deltaproteobacteria bacterium]|nr:hypothetical protein [Deltaproteobacteria bacterium]
MLKKTIDKIDFSVEKLDVFEANDLDRETQELLPVILRGIELATDKEDVLDLDFKQLAEAVEDLFKAMDREKFKDFSVRMCACVTAVVDGAPCRLTDAEAVGNIGLKVSGLYKLLYAVMEENGFLPFELLTSGGPMRKILNSLGVSKLPKPSTNKSDE